MPRSLVYEAHPAADAFPLLSKSDPERFNELVCNIRENGLLEPITLFDGKVLDGRNRLLACRAASVTPRFVEFVPNGVGPAQWVAAKHTRRDLDASQRAAAAVALLPLLAQEAKERQRLGKQKVADPRAAGQARDKAASLTGANHTYVSDAQRIIAKDSRMLARLRDGEITIPEALKQFNFKRRIVSLMSDESNEWYTPAKYANAAREVLGHFDLDPASCELANSKVIKADEFYSKEDDGLHKSWRGRIWLNPPYGDIGPKFVSKLVREFESGRVMAAIVLVNAHATDAKWFQPLFNYALCFTDHRPQFWTQDGVSDRSTHGSVFAYLGRRRNKFSEAFSQFGAVLWR